MAVATGGGAADQLKKTSWPEVVGWEPLVAGLKIHGDRPDIVRFEFHHLGDAVPPGHDDDRVRLFLAPGPETVAATPFIG
uniref:Uncharacterized protein n=1 Tax=Aegilops tauschii TaxID=37682 RepID=M8C1P6_AEGTA